MTGRQLWISGGNGGVAGRAYGVPAGLYCWSSRGGGGRDPAGRTPLGPSAPPWLTPSVISADRVSSGRSYRSLSAVKRAGSDRWF